MQSKLIVLGVLLLATVAPAQKATITLKKLVEKREMTTEKESFFNDKGIELTLHIDGPDVQGARKIGNLTVTKAVDDVGTDLNKQDEATMSSDSFQEIQEPMSFGDDDKKPKPTGFDLDVNLPQPSARNAKMIKQVSGSVQVLVGGEKKIVKVQKLKSSLGKAVDDPVLKSAGVTIKLLDPGSAGLATMMGEKDKTVPAEISGNMDLIAKVRIVDAADEDHSQMSMKSGEEGKSTVMYFLDKSLDDDLTLEIELWPGQKTVTIPIELKDVKLP
jgi:hypothetical protein